MTYRRLTIIITAQEKEVQIGFQEFRQFLMAFSVLPQRLKEFEPFIKFHNSVLEEKVMLIIGEDEQLSLKLIKRAHTWL